MYWVVRLLTGALMVVPNTIVKLMGWKEDRIVAGPFDKRKDAEFASEATKRQRSRTE